MIPGRFTCSEIKEIELVYTRDRTRFGPSASSHSVLGHVKSVSRQVRQIVSHRFADCDFHWMENKVSKMVGNGHRRDPIVPN